MTFMQFFKDIFDYNLELVKDFAPILAVIFCHMFIFAVLKSAKKGQKCTIVEHLVAGGLTALAYFVFIDTFNLARFDYIFDFLFRLKFLFLEIANYARSAILVNTNIFPTIRSFEVLLDALRMNGIGLNRIYFYSLKLTFTNFVSDFVFEITKAFNVFKKDVVYTNNINYQELCVYRC